MNKAHEQSEQRFYTLDDAERDIRAKLPQLYRNNGEREIVNTLLIPQLRAELDAVFVSVNSKKIQGAVLTPPEIAALCAAVDIMLEAKKVLLDTEGLLKPVIAKMRAVRSKVRASLDGQFIEDAKAMLAAHGITDRKSLLAFGPQPFMDASFPPHGKGQAFTGRILGSVYRYVTTPHLEQIADKLGWPKPDEDAEKQNFIRALALHDITDRQSLLAFGLLRFRRTSFPPYGKGIAFVSRILGNYVGKDVTVAHLEQIADKLGWEKPDEDTEKRNYIRALAAHGITDRESLLAFGAHPFIRTSFSPYGKGKAFAGRILGSSVGLTIVVAHLEQIADKLGWEKPDEDTEKQNFIRALALHGITDRKSLLAFGPQRFMDTSFPPYGKGHAFASRIFNNSVGRFVVVAHLKLIADKLGW